MKLRRTPPRSALFAVPLALFAAAPAAAQGTHLDPPANGPRRLGVERQALVGATVHVAPGHAIEDATIVFQEDRILWVGSSRLRAGFAAGARTWDVSGLHVYPGWIDPHVEIEVPAPTGEEAELHWNESVTPQRGALDGGGISEKVASELRELGFTAAAIAPREGVIRGTGAVVSLAEPPDDPSLADPPVHAAGAFQTVSFDRFRNWGRDDGVARYPDSQMGAIALLRQTLSDAAWQRQARIDERWTGGPNALDALLPVEGGPAPLAFVSSDELEILRFAKILEEHEGLRAWVVGSGSELRRLEAVRATGLPIVLPLDFPDVPDVSSIGAVEDVSLRRLMTWEQAPTNPRRLHRAGVEASLSTHRLEERDEFPERLREAIRHGLAEDAALAMLTVAPARLLGLEERLGTLEAGKVANAIVCDGPIFDEDTVIRAVWIDGRRHEIEREPEVDLAGEWEVTLAPPVADAIAFEIDEENAITVRSEGGSTEAEGVRFEDRRLSFVFEHATFGEPGVYVLSASVDGEGEEIALVGTGQRADGRRFTWTAARASAPEEEDEEREVGEEGGGEDAEEDEDDPPDVPEALPGLPFGPYALREPPAAAAFVEVHGATLWTSRAGDPVVLEDATLVARDGRIVHVGGPWEGERPEGAVRIDASGKHVTPGLIDCHSHTGISAGVNESGQAVTAEVRIGDVTDPDDVDWYRQLAGGLTVANCLHGSANPIGGQNQVVKLRWGALHPDDMHLEGAPPGIKFALGENVKQANWGDAFDNRYPQTRMGVETLIRDRFLAAREYARHLAGWQGGNGFAEPPRRDLELEALVEVLEGERLVHCHSYRQDEILMLCRIAEDFGFRIGTFQHVLEGYKVAEAIAEHARGASCFSDWWAYKVEVQDAIPYAGALMHEVGVNVSFNSDSADLARRMNAEAAKAVRYGGVPPAEALWFVTLNPAIQLGIDDRVGSLEVGKDADFVIWSGDPLSTFSRCEATWIDGAEHFSIERDAKLRDWNAAERRRIVQKLLEEVVGDSGEDEEEDEDEGEPADEDPEDPR